MEGKPDWLSGCLLYTSWLNSPKLTGFFGGANAFFQEILSSAGARNVTAAVDAVASATSSAEETLSSGVALFSYRILGYFDLTLVSGSEVASSTLADYALKFDFPLINWFVSTLVLPYDGVQLFMQIFIVVAEILIGLLLVFGLLTFLSLIHI